MCSIKQQDTRRNKSAATALFYLLKALHPPDLVALGVVKGEETMTAEFRNPVIRDNVPQIQQRKLVFLCTRRLKQTEYFQSLKDQLLIQVQSYIDLKSPARGGIEELADIGETIHAILAYKNISVEEFQKERLELLEKYGGYTKRLTLADQEELWN